MHVRVLLMIPHGNCFNTTRLVDTGTLQRENRSRAGTADRNRTATAAIATVWPARSETRGLMLLHVQQRDWTRGELSAMIFRTEGRRACRRVVELSRYLLCDS